MLCPNVEHNLSWKVTGSVSPCNNIVGFPKFFSVRDMLDSKEYKSLLQDNINNAKSAYCTRCWDKETLNLKSKRQSDLLLHNIQSSFRQDYLKIDSAIGDKCNAACTICGPYSSSTWQKFIPINSYENKSELWNVCTNHADRLIQLDFGGGEPWLNAVDEQIQLFESLIERNLNKRIKIRYNTNGSVFPKKLLNLLTQFQEVEITLSLDDIESRFEYNRWPLKWAFVEKNINRLKELREKYKQIRLTVNFTVSVFTWHRVEKFLKWAKVNDLTEVNFNILSTPEVFSIKSLPHKFKSINTQFDELVSSHPMPDWEQVFLRTVTELDTVRNISWKTAFPELVAIL